MKENLRHDPRSVILSAVQDRIVYGLYVLAFQLEIGGTSVYNHHYNLE